MTFVKRIVWSVVLAMAACGGKSKPPESPPPAAPENTASLEPAPAEEAAPAYESFSGLPACDQYVYIMEQYMRCPAIDQTARDSARQGIDAMKQAWASADLQNAPEDVKKQTNDACAQANDAIRQGAAALGCPL